MPLWLLLLLCGANAVVWTLILCRPWMGLQSLPWARPRGRRPPEPPPKAPRWRKQLEAQAGKAPCLLCRSARHAWEEHVRYTQRELALREADPESLFGEW